MGLPQPRRAQDRGPDQDLAGLGILQRRLQAVLQEPLDLQGQPGLALPEGRAVAVVAHGSTTSRRAHAAPIILGYARPLAARNAALQHPAGIPLLMHQDPAGHETPVLLREVADGLPPGIEDLHRVPGPRPALEQIRGIPGQQLPDGALGQRCQLRPAAPPASGPSGRGWRRA